MIRPISDIDDQRVSTILIVDDSQDNIEILLAALRDEGYKLYISRNGLQAIESVKLNPPDLILMDIQMPKMDGYTACEKIKMIDQCRLIPVIFISGMNVFFNKKKAFDVGGVDYIEKPFNLDEVKIRIKTHLDLYHYQLKLKRTNVKLLQMFKSAFEQTTVAMAHINTETRQILRANHYFTNLFGYRPDEVRKLSILDIIEPDYKNALEQLFDDYQTNVNETKYCECLCRNRKNIELWAQINLTLIKDESGKPEFFHLVFEDITKQVKNKELISLKNEQLKKSIDEKEVLIKELYHRTKNNMQVIASMIHLKAASFDQNDKYAFSVLQDIESKIYSMSLVHKLLYRSDNLSYISTQEYIQELIYLFRSIQNNKFDNMEIEYEIEDFPIIIDIALPIGLILSELLSNSYKHGFPDNQKGRILIKLSKTDERILCSYQDDGIGVSVKDDIINSGSIGLLIVKNLVEQQLLGSITQREVEQGVYYSMEFHTQMYVARV